MGGALGSGSGAMGLNGPTSAEAEISGVVTVPWAACGGETGGVAHERVGVIDRTSRPGETKSSTNVAMPIVNNTKAAAARQDRSRRTPAKTTGVAATRRRLSNGTTLVLATLPRAACARIRYSRYFESGTIQLRLTARLQENALQARKKLKLRQVSPLVLGAPDPAGLADPQVPPCRPYPRLVFRLPAVILGLANSLVSAHESKPRRLR